MKHYKNQVTMNQDGLLEPALGEVFELAGLHLRCVETTVCSIRSCCLCQLYHMSVCAKVACIRCEREDGLNVHFVPDLQM